MKGGLKVAVVAAVAGLAITMMAMVEPVVAIECKHVEALIAPCLDYLTGGVPDPSGACCCAISTLKFETPTPPDRRDACECLKAAASRYAWKIIDERAASLPNRCNIDVGVPISKDINCDDVH